MPVVMPKSDFEISPINNIENTVTPLPDDDEYTTIYNVKIVGVPQLDNYRSCLQCKARVEPLTPPLGKCTREDCMMMQLFDLCQDQLSARVLLRHINDKRQHNHVTCSAFGDMVYQLANLPNNHTCNCSRPPQMTISYRQDYNLCPATNLTHLTNSLMYIVNFSHLYCIHILPKHTT